MAKDDETGIDPVARDGEVNDELAKRRTKGNGKGKSGGNGGQSVAERAANGGEPGDPKDEELDGQFSMGLIQGDRVTLAKLIKSGTPIEVETSMMSASVPGRDGLLDPSREHLLIVAVEPAKYEPVPVRERGKGQTKIDKWKIRQHLRVVQVANADSQAGRDMLGLPPKAVGE